MRVGTRLERFLEIRSRSRHIARNVVVLTTHRDVVGSTWPRLEHRAGAQRPSGHDEACAGPSPSNAATRTPDERAQRTPRASPVRRQDHGHPARPGRPRGTPPRPPPQPRRPLAGRGRRTPPSHARRCALRAPRRERRRGRPPRAAAGAPGRAPAPVSTTGGEPSRDAVGVREGRGQQARLGKSGPIAVAPTDRVGEPRRLPARETRAADPLTVTAIERALHTPAVAARASRTGNAVTSDVHLVDTVEQRRGVVGKQAGEAG